MKDPETIDEIISALEKQVNDAEDLPDAEDFEFLEHLSIANRDIVKRLNSYINDTYGILDVCSYQLSKLYKRPSFETPENYKDRTKKEWPKNKLVLLKRPNLRWKIMEYANALVELEYYISGIHNKKPVILISHNNEIPSEDWELK